MTEDILHNMEQKKKYKNNNHIEYQQLNKEKLVAAEELRSNGYQISVKKLRNSKNATKQKKCMRKLGIKQIRKIRRNKHLVLF